MRRIARRILIAAAGTIGVAAAGLVIWLSRSQVVQTAGGVYESILIPVGSGAIKWRADQAVVAPAPSLNAMHGPVVRRLGGGQHEVAWYCDDHVERDTLPADSVTIECEGRRSHWQWRAPAAVPAADLPAAPRVAVVSDLEGDSAYFGIWVRAMGITDSLGHWTYGNGQVVVLGDATDRGRWVYPLLWTLYRLEGEAQAAGGAVHVVLGNHEQYNLTGVTKDIEAEHHFAMRQLARYHQLLDSNTVLGQWLRTRPVALRIGRTLYVHGGVSPAVLRDQLSIDTLNARSRDYLAGKSGPGRTRDDQLGLTSVTQYRGLVMGMEGHPLADDQHIQRTLEHFAVDRVVIGHTEVDSIAVLHNGRVIDVNATLSGTKALLLEQDVPRLVDIGVQRSAWAEPSPRLRRFQLLNANDWRALLGVFAATKN